MKQRRPSIFVAAIVVLLVAVVIYILVTLNSPVPTFPVELPKADKSPDSDIPDYTHNQYAAVTPETVQAVIASMARPEGYTRSVTVEDFWGDSSSTVEFTVQVSGASTKITTLSRQGIKYILTTDTGTWIWYDTLDEAFYTAAGTPYDGDQWVRVLTYEDLLSLSPEEITGAGYEEHNGVWCVYASYDTPNFGYHSTLWISAVDGLLNAAEIYDGDTLIYRMTGSTADTVIPDDSVFIPPMVEDVPTSVYRISTANTQEQ